MHTIHIVSGGTGASAEQLVRTVLAQFVSPALDVKIHAAVRDLHAVNQLLAALDPPNVTVVHTLVAPQLRDALARQADARGIAHIDLVGALSARLTAVLAAEPAGVPGRYRALRAEYFERVDAVEFAVDHDDGRRSAEWPTADVLVLGTSRVGKTPLCMYLAAHGWKAANLPLVRGIEPPADLARVASHRVVGLTIDSSRLLEHRTWRSQQLGLGHSTSYIDPSEIEHDIDDARQLYRRHRFAVIDVTDRPVEELAHAVMTRVGPIGSRTPA